MPVNYAGETVFSAKEIRKNLCLHGRTRYDEDGDLLYINWSCSGVSFSFTGTKLSLGYHAVSGTEYDGTPGDPDAPTRTVWPRLAVFLDGAEEPACVLPLCEESGVEVLLCGDREMRHTVRLVKLTENLKTGIAIRMLSADGEIRPLPKSSPVRKIEFIGDSITCGYGNMTQDPSHFFYSEEENGWLSYAALAARALGAEWSMVCSSGICTAPRKEIPLPYAMNELYSLTDGLGTDGEKWDFYGNPVDDIVVNLGTNDSAAAAMSGDPDSLETQFILDYCAFLKQVRRLNGPKARIICTIGSMDYYFSQAIWQAVRKYRTESGDKLIWFFRLHRISPMDPMGACGHPNVITHQKMAQQLAAFLSGCCGNTGEVST